MYGCRFQSGAPLPVAWCLVKYLLPSLFKKQHGPVCLIQQVSDMDPQVAGLVSSGHLSACSPGDSVGLPNLREQCCRLRYQVWQVWRTVPQAQPGVSAQLMELIQFFEGLVHQSPVSAGRGLGAWGSWTCCCHHFTVVCASAKWTRTALNIRLLICLSVYLWVGMGWGGEGSNNS